MRNFREVWVNDGDSHSWRACSMIGTAVAVTLAVEQISSTESPVSCSHIT